MKYLILIHDSEAAWAAMAPAELEQGMAAFRAYSEALTAAGKTVAASQLAPSATAKHVTAHNGALRVVDGPYADVKEQLGGFYLIDVDSEAEAIEWARKCPGVQFGGVEVRKCV